MRKQDSLTRYPVYPIGEHTMNGDNTKTKRTILIVDDLPANITLLRRDLEPENKVLVATSGESGIRLACREKPDLILLDVLMPQIDGFETCRRLKLNDRTADIPIIFVTAKDETDGVVEGFDVGGVDYIIRPFEKAELLARVNTHLKINQLTQDLTQTAQQLQQKNRELEQEISKRQQAEEALRTADEHLSMLSRQEAQRWGIEGIVGQSLLMAKILSDVRRLHKNDTTNVLILGESGTGKELIARAIHFGGIRKAGPFIALNCSAIPSELAEDELFGHVRGAFSGATESRKGRFELANSGTLFLDEIGDMPPPLQAKLLRVIEDGCIMPVGGTHERRVDVRIIAATHADLRAKMEAGEFREDLYYRLAGFTVTVPPLRERQEDIPLLAQHFLTMFAGEMGKEKAKLSPDALLALQQYPFPGNIRQLKNIIEAALIASDGEELRPNHLSLSFPHLEPRDMENHASELGARNPPELAATLPLNLREAEAILIRRALKQAHGLKGKAAKLLGINRKTLFNKMRGLEDEIWSANQQTDSM
jgi:DNA-binding NtrC family response regulator